MWELYPVTWSWGAKKQASMNLIWRMKRDGKWIRKHILGTGKDFAWKQAPTSSGSRTPPLDHDGAFSSWEIVSKDDGAMLGRSLDDASPSTVVSIVIFTDYFARGERLSTGWSVKELRNTLRGLLSFWKFPSHSTPNVFEWWKTRCINMQENLVYLHRCA